MRRWPRRLGDPRGPRQARTRAATRSHRGACADTRRTSAPERKRPPPKGTNSPTRPQARGAGRGGSFRRAPRIHPRVDPAREPLNARYRRAARALSVTRRPTSSRAARVAPLRTVFEPAGERLPARPEDERQEDRHGQATRSEEARELSSWLALLAARARLLRLSVDGRTGKPGLPRTRPRYSSRYLPRRRSAGPSPCAP